MKSLSIAKLTLEKVSESVHSVPEPNTSTCLCSRCEEFTDASRPAPLHASLQGFPNPYPDILTSRYLNDAEHDYLEAGRMRSRVLDEDAPVHYDIRILEDEDEIFPDDVEDYLSAKEKLRNSLSWKRFSAGVLPKFAGVPITTAVCLGPGSGCSPSVSYKSTENFFYEIASFVLMVEMIQENQSLRGDGLQTVIPKIYQDPRFVTADARLLEVLTGGDVVYHPHARSHIEPNTFLYALHMEHPVMWDFALRDYEPAVSLGNNLQVSRAWLMADILVEAKHTDGSLDELHELYDRSNNYINNRRVYDVPVVTMPSEVDSEVVEIFQGAQLRYPLSTRQAPPASELEWNIGERCPPSYIDERSLITAREGLILRNYHKRERLQLPLADQPVYINTEIKSDLAKQSSQTTWEIERREVLGRYGLVQGSDEPLSEMFKARLYHARDQYLSSPQWQAFASMATKALREAPADNIVCLAIGSIFRAKSEEQIYVFVQELAAVLAIKVLMGEAAGLRLNSSGTVPKDNGPVRLVFQDPALGMDDARLLESLEGRCCIGNHGAKLINSSSFVFAKCIAWDVAWDVAIRGDGPAIWLGSGLGWTSNLALASAYVDEDWEEMEEVRGRSQAYMSSCHHVKLEAPPATNVSERSFRGSWAEQELWWKKAWAME